MATGDARDALLLGFTDIDGYGVLTAPGTPGTAAGVAAASTAAVAAALRHQGHDMGQRAA